MNTGTVRSLFTLIVSGALGSLGTTGCAAAADDEADVADDAEELAAPSALKKASEDITDFYKVRKGLYRGAVPGEKVGKQGLLDLKAVGVRTIVNLQSGSSIDGDNQAEIDSDEKWAKEVGLRWIHKPLRTTPVHDEAFDQKLADIEEILDPKHRSKYGAVYVHCKHGHDRTGLVVGIERVKFDLWKPEMAFGEMLCRQYHPEFLTMNKAFRHATGWNPNNPLNTAFYWLYKSEYASKYGAVCK